MALADLRHYVRTYDDCLDGALCARMIAAFHGLSPFHAANGAGVRRGLEASRWTELNVSRHADGAFLGSFRRTIATALARYNADVGLAIQVPDSGTHSDLVMKQYRPGGSEKFQLHFDAINHVANRYLVLLWYLNDVAAGGGTRFPDLDLVVAPRAGRLLIFPPYWMYQHEGLAPAAGEKYIVSTYLLFTAHPAS